MLNGLLGFAKANKKKVLVAVGGLALLGVGALSRVLSKDDDKNFIEVEAEVKDANEEVTNTEEPVAESEN